MAFATKNVLLPFYSLTARTAKIVRYCHIFDLHKINYLQPKNEVKMCCGGGTMWASSPTFADHK